jgi:hypothetical protein
MKWHVFAMLVSVAISIVGIAFITTQTDPYNSAIIRLLFFATLLILSWGSSAIIMLFVKYKSAENKFDDKSILKSYIIGFIVSIILLGIIALNIWI